MRRGSIGAMIALGTLGLGLLGCGGDGTPPRLGTSYITVEVGGRQRVFGVTTQSYSAASGRTTLRATDAENDRNYVEIVFPGQSPGTWTQAGQETDLSYADGAGVLYTEYDGGSHTIMCRRYGDVGEMITGSVWGSVRDALTGRVLTLTKGVFQVTREQ
jgi:hypothetical protein